MEKVEYDIKVYDNFIEIIPKNPIADNSVYDIRLKDIKTLDGKKVLDNETVSICTAVTPAYTTLDSVKSLVEACGISDREILLKIREASRTADFIIQGINGPTLVNNTDIMIPRIKEQASVGTQTTVNELAIPFEVSEYVKYKAAKESILKFYINKAAVAGEKGALGDISFEHQPKMPDIKALLDELTAQIKFWQDAIRGYGIEGRAKPKSTLHGRNAIPLSIGTVNSLSPVYQGYDRGV